jgi:hypothetical protein
MPALTAEYTSPTTTSPHTITATLPTISNSPSTDDRVAYLAELQNAVKAVQGDINEFLTKKMEEDKAISGKLDDEKLEENYGEEIVEDN